MNSFHFRALEHYHQPKTADWYWAVGIIAVAAVATAIIFNNILFAILIVLAAFSLAMHAARPPREQDIVINEAGVTVGKYHFSYANLESFWLEHHAHACLLLKSRKIIMPHIVIPVDELGDDEREDIRSFLRTKISEEEQTEPLFEQIMERIGF